MFQHFGLVLLCELRELLLAVLMQFLQVLAFILRVGQRPLRQSNAQLVSRTGGTHKMANCGALIN